MKLIGININKSKANCKFLLREKNFKTSNKIFGLQKINSYI